MIPFYTLSGWCRFSSCLNWAPLSDGEMRYYHCMNGGKRFSCSLLVSPSPSSSQYTHTHTQIQTHVVRRAWWGTVIKTRLASSHAVLSLLTVLHLQLHIPSIVRRRSIKEEKWFPQWWINYIPQDLSFDVKALNEMKQVSSPHGFLWV